MSVNPYQSPSVEICNAEPHVSFIDVAGVLVLLLVAVAAFPITAFILLSLAWTDQLEIDCSKEEYTCYAIGAAGTWFIASAMMWCMWGDAVALWLK